MAIQAARLGRFLVALAASVLLRTTNLVGETWTWDGGGVNNNWTTALNWDPGIGRDSAPDNDGTADIVMAGTTRLTPRVDVDWDIDSLTFNSTAGGFSISGDPGVSLGIGEGGITNNNAQLQTLLLPIVLDASQTWTAAAGPLSIGNTVAGHPILTRTLTLGGANNINIAGAITTGITLNKTGTGTLTFNGVNTNSYTGTTTVSAGTLALGRTGGPNRAVPGNLVIGDGTGGAAADVVRLDAADQIVEDAGRTVTVSSSGLLNLNGFNETVANLAINGGSISGAGSLVVNEVLTFTGGGSISTAAVSALTSPVVVNGGLLSISSGGQLSSKIASIASTAGSTATVDVSGGSWIFDPNDSVFEIGASGSGGLNITNGGFVGCQPCNGEGETLVGGSASSTGFGEVHVDNGQWWNDVLNVYGGSLELSTGLIAAWRLRLHGSDSSTASATVEGPMSRVLIEDELAVGSIVGRGGILEIRDGARVEGNTETLVFVNKDGSLLVDGGSILTAGTATISGGAAGDGAIATIDGPGSNWTTNAHDLIVGNDGTGTLNITSGGLVESGEAVVGRLAGSIGTVVVEGVDGTARSRWRTGFLEIGDSGSGTLHVTGGAEVRSNECYIGGGQTGADGTVIVDGASQTTASELIARAGLFIGTGNGSGALHITNGGYVEVIPEPPPLPIGPLLSETQIGPNGIVTVEGGSILTAPGTFNVGSEGQLNINNSSVDVLDAEIGPASTQGITDIEGSVIVEDGGQLSSEAELHIGRTGNTSRVELKNGGRLGSGLVTVGRFGVGTVTVDGANSQFSGVRIEIAVDGTGTLSVTNGGAVLTTTDLALGPLGEINGNGNVIGRLENGGLVSPGMSAGALNVDGDYSQSAAGELLIELASASSFDQLLITGEAELSGLLTVNFIDGFTPSAGQSFTIITSDDIDDTFTMEAFPSVPNLAFDVIYNAQSVVLTVSAVGLPGDYNNDGSVDAADYVVWRENPDGFGGSAGYDTWRTNFGRTAASGSGSIQLVPVPEPCALIMVCVALAVGWPRCRRHLDRFC